MPQSEPLLAFDAGNTSVKGALRAGGPWERLLRVPTRPTRDLAARLKAAFPEGRAAVAAHARCVACSVHPAAVAAIEEAMRELGAAAAVELFGRDLPVSLTVAVREPETVGTDRLLLALAGRELAGAPCIVVSAGTAVTVDLVDGEGRFAGGAIAPGLAAAARALHREAALLPLVSPARPEAAVGLDTEGAIRSGVYWFCAGGVRALVAEYERLVGRGELPLVLTGSDAELLLPALSGGAVLCEPDLIFHGMAAALAAGG